jgi:hypothetical protein
MPTTLIAEVQFPALAPGVPTALPHGLNIEGAGVVPDKVELDNAQVAFVSADDASVTVRNDGTGPTNCVALCRRWHSAPRVLPAGQANLPVQPFVPGGGVSSGLADNLTIPVVDGVSYWSPTERTIYVRPAGSDLTGDGSLGNPYATIERALQDVPMVIKSNMAYCIDLTGMGTIPISATPYLIGYLGDSLTKYDYVNNWRSYHGALTFQAEPTVLDTIQAGDVTGVITDPDSTLKTLQTTKAWVPSAYKGAIALGPSGSFECYAIADNTATDLKLCSRYTPSYPLQIVVPSAELQADASAYYAMSLWNNKCSIAFCGIKLTGFASSWGVGLLAYGGNESIIGWGSQFSSMQLSGYPTSPNGTSRMIGCSFLGDGVQKCGWKSMWDDFYSCYFDTVERTEVGYHEMSHHEIQQACVMDGCEPFGIGWGYSDLFLGGATIYKCEILNAVGYGAAFYSSTEPSILKDVLIANAASDAVYARGPVYLDLADVGGGGNGRYGVKLTNGATAYHRWGTDVTGVAGDYQVGSNPPAPGAGVGWAAFVAAGWENDLGAAADPQMCRMFTTLNP